MSSRTPISALPSLDAKGRRPRGRAPRDDVIVHYVDPHGRAQHVSGPEAGHVLFEKACLVRRIPNHEGQTNVIGEYWCATTGGLVPAESYLERCWLTLLDFDPGVTALAVQPFRITGRLDGTVIDHVPDIFVRRDGLGVVLDVRATALQDETFLAKTAITRRFTDRAGLGYEVVAEPDPQRWANVSFLASARFPLPVGHDYIDRLVAMAAMARPMRDLIMSGVDEPVIVRKVVLHLCWTHRLLAPLDEPLSDWTLVVAAPSGRPR